MKQQQAVQKPGNAAVAWGREIRRYNMRRGLWQHLARVLNLSSIELIPQEVRPAARKQADGERKNGFARLRQSAGYIAEFIKCMHHCCWPVCLDLVVNWQAEVAFS